ncbi:MAG: hypothetical protein CMJ25_31310 [Phycisphaerae bacterium]|nr:hypothetical protein [Phycisphaerae bacterium]
MSTSFYDVDVTDDNELDAEDHARLQMISELIEYRMNSMGVSELLVTASAYLSQELENRSTGDLEALYKQLFGEVH